MDNPHKKIFFGPMSKLVIDCVIQYSEFGFIPSRRQIDECGGYVGFTSKQFRDYVGTDVIICRDHGGPGQGVEMDDGFDTIRDDAEYFNIIHIDPWKAFPEHKDALSYTVEQIKFLDKNNYDVMVEVGTEQAIRQYGVLELEQFLIGLKHELSKKQFEKILYVVVQGGVGLDLPTQKNIGMFNQKQLESMINLCQQYGKLSKEHNGDYLTDSEIKTRFDMGLDSLNIAPEIAQIETKAIVEKMNQGQINDFYNMCAASGKWEKWMPNGMNKYSDVELIITCGHYLFSDPSFIKIRESIDDVDNYVKLCIIQYLERMRRILRDYSI